jgi:hypothetical protein
MTTAIFPVCRKHMLSKHQVGLLSGGGAPTEPEAITELDAPFGVILAEGWIGDHPVEPH